MKTIKLVSLLLFLISFKLSFSQEQPVIRTFSTEQYMKETASSDALRNDQEKQIDKHIKTFTRKGDNREYVLPIVFHIVESPAMPNINKALINSQLEALNRDFNSTEIIANPPNDLNGIYKNRIGNPMIQFCTPLLDEQGHKTNGVVRKSINKSQFRSSNSVKEIAAPWHTQKYINVWVTDLGEESAGYAQMPGADPTVDGIVIDYKYFGQGKTAMFPYDEGKTLTHLMGNYLGLYPLWGEMDCGDDQVDDTPIHNSINFTCPEFDHVSTCDGYPTEMTMNFMDATYDACRYMFTKGQIKRMQAILSKQGFRHRLSQTQTKCESIEMPVSENTKDSQLSEDEPEIIATINVFPNPAQERVYLSFEDMNTQDCIQLKVVDANGKLVHQVQLNHDESEHKLDIRSWTPGIYFLNFEFDNQLVTKRLIAL